MLDPVVLGYRIAGVLCVLAIPAAILAGQWLACTGPDWIQAGWIPAEEGSSARYNAPCVAASVAILVLLVVSGIVFLHAADQRHHWGPRR